MAQDGLIFGWLGYVNSWTGTQLIASCLSGLLVALSALVFDLEALVQMMSIGTLMAYALVSVSVLVLHYQREQVGMTASDEVAASCSTTCNGATAASTAAATSSSTKTVSMTEDTGLLRIADPTNRVRYVPTKTTTVVKRIKPSADSDEDQPTNSSSMQSSQIVAERTAAELHQQRHLANTDANCIDNSSSYRRLDSDYSIDSLSQLFNAGIEASARPTGRSRRIAILCITVISMVWTIFCLLTVYAWSKLVGVEWWAVTLATCCLLILLSLIILLARQPRDDTRLHFRVPFVPWIPLASVLINIYLMVTLSTATWIRFAVWMTLGMIIYLSYGVWHSTERRKPDDNNDTSQVILYDIADKNSLIIDGVYR
jgi:cationic amino acid transporter 14